MARPNVLMFGDVDCDGTRSGEQYRRLNAWMRSLAEGRLVLIECGAGKAVPTIRRYCEQTARQESGTLVRINPREPDVPAGHVALPMGALDALRAIDALVSS